MARREGPKEWGPQTGARATGTTLREIDAAAKAILRLPGRRWVVCWTEDIEIPEAEYPEIARVLDAYSVAHEVHEDRGPLAYVDHTEYFDEGQEADALARYGEVIRTAHNATLALSVHDTEWY